MLSKFNELTAFRGLTMLLWAIPGSCVGTLLMIIGFALIVLFH